MLSLRMALVSVSVSVLGPGSSVAAAPAAAPGFAAGIVRPPLPPMGWRSWNWFACDVDQSIMEQQAAAMAATPPWATKSLRQLGYTHIGLDDCWQSCIGESSASLQTNRQHRGHTGASCIGWPAAAAALHALLRPWRSWPGRQRRPHVGRELQHPRPASEPPGSSPDTATATATAQPAHTLWTRPRTRPCPRANPESRAAPAPCRTRSRLRSRSRAVDIITTGCLCACVPACLRARQGPDGSFHDRTGTPIVNTTRFPSLSGMVAKAKSHGLTSGFYGNNCRCHQGERERWWLSLLLRGGWGGGGGGGTSIKAG